MRHLANVFISIPASTIVLTNSQRAIMSRLRPRVPMFNFAFNTDSEHIGRDGRYIIYIQRGSSIVICYTKHFPWRNCHYILLFPIKNSLFASYDLMVVPILIATSAKKLFRTKCYHKNKIYSTCSIIAAPWRWWTRKQALSWHGYSIFCTKRNTNIYSIVCVFVFHAGFACSF